MFITLTTTITSFDCGNQMHQVIFNYLFIHLIILHTKDYFIWPWKVFASMCLSFITLQNNNYLIQLWTNFKKMLCRSRIALYQRRSASYQGVFIVYRKRIKPTFLTVTVLTVWVLYTAKQTKTNRPSFDWKHVWHQRVLLLYRTKSFGGQQNFHIHKGGCLTKEEE